MDLRKLSVKRLQSLIKANEKKENQLKGVMSNAYMTKLSRATNQLRKALEYNLNK
jgi:hypothetical protein